MIILVSSLSERGVNKVYGTTTVVVVPPGLDAHVACGTDKLLSIETAACCHFFEKKKIISLKNDILQAIAEDLCIYI